jgi:hypothetical protein
MIINNFVFKIKILKYSRFLIYISSYRSINTNNNKNLNINYKKKSNYLVQNNSQLNNNSESILKLRHKHISYLNRRMISAINLHTAYSLFFLSFFLLYFSLSYTHTLSFLGFVSFFFVFFFFLRSLLYTL